MAVPTQGLSESLEELLAGLGDAELQARHISARFCNSSGSCVAEEAIEVSSAVGRLLSRSSGLHKLDLSNRYGMCSKEWATFMTPSIWAPPLWAKAAAPT